MSIAKELENLDALSQADLVHRKEVKPSELVEAAIGRIERINSKLNAVIHTVYDQAFRAAGAWEAEIRAGRAGNVPFCGVPFLLKDLLAECKDTPFNEGSKAVKGYVSKLDSEIVKRQKAGGLIVLGKTNTCEFGLLPTTEPALFGATLNPWNTALTAGGSSGGSAVAVASGMLPMAHGSDGGGSLRIPASCCGIFGFKPSRGRNPFGPLFGEAAGGLAHEHAVSRTVRDSAALLDLTSGPDVGDPYFAPPKERAYLEETSRDPGRLRIGFLSSVPDGWHKETDLHPDCAEAVEDAANLCESLGHTVEAVDSKLFSDAAIGGVFGKLFDAYAAHVFEYWKRELGREITEDQVEPFSWESARRGLKMSAGKYLQAQEDMHRFSRKIAAWYEDGRYDVLLTPTMRIAPVAIGSFRSTAQNPMGWLEPTISFVVFTRVQNMTGQPAMSVPLFWNRDNIPIGVQFAAKFGEEGILFRLAAQLESARPWQNRKAPHWIQY
ncbi:MAG: amidase [Desulfobacteraceae bacterium]|nr:amidase [Desulfobacteraceae bacterium]